jgi:hypothetical protein
VAAGTLEVKNFGHVRKIALGESSGKLAAGSGAKEALLRVSGGTL